MDQQSCSRCVFGARAMRYQDVFYIVCCFSRPSVKFFERDFVFGPQLTSHPSYVCLSQKIRKSQVCTYRPSTKCCSTLYKENRYSPCTVSDERCHGAVVQTSAHANRLGGTLSRSSFANLQNSGKERRPSFSFPSSKRFITKSVAVCSVQCDLEFAFTIYL